MCIAMLKLHRSSTFMSHAVRRRPCKRPVPPSVPAWCLLLLCLFPATPPQLLLQVWLSSPEQPSQSLKAVWAEQISTDYPHQLRTSQSRPLQPSGLQVHQHGERRLTCHEIWCPDILCPFYSSLREPGLESGASRGGKCPGFP